MEVKIPVSEMHVRRADQEECERIAEIAALHGVKAARVGNLERADQMRKAALLFIGLAAGGGGEISIVGGPAGMAVSGDPSFTDGIPFRCVGDCWCKGVAAITSTVQFFGARRDGLIQRIR